MARPTVLNDIVAERIRQAVRKGATWAIAAEAAGVGSSTLREWKARGRAGEEPYAAFLATIKRAEAEAFEEACERIQVAAIETWQAAAWLLERRRPKSYALRRPVETEKPVTPEEADALVAEAAKLAGAK